MKKSQSIYLLVCAYLLMAVINVVAAQTFNKGDIKFKRGSHLATLFGTVIQRATK